MMTNPLFRDSDDWCHWNDEGPSPLQTGALQPDVSAKPQSYRLTF